MMKKAFTLLVEDFFIVTCCPERARMLEEEYRVVIMHYTENPMVKPPHCGLGCLKSKSRRKKDEKVTV